MPSPADDTKEIPDRLIRELLSGRLIPFVGAGVSRSVDRRLFPSWTDLLERLAVRLEREAKPDEAVAVRYACKKGRWYQAAEEALRELGAAEFFGRAPGVTRAGTDTWR